MNHVYLSMFYAMAGFSTVKHVYLSMLYAMAGSTTVNYVYIMVASITAKNFDIRSEAYIQVL